MKASAWWVAFACLSSCGGRELPLQVPVGPGHGTIAGRVVEKVPTPPASEAEPRSAQGEASVVVPDLVLDRELTGWLVVTNTTGEALHVTLDPRGDTRLEVPVTEGEVPAGGSASFEVSVDADGLERGTHRRELEVRWEGGSTLAGIVFEVLIGPSDRPIEIAAFSREVGGFRKRASLWVTVERPEFRLVLPPGEYILQASTDDDMDGQAFENGERVAGFPSIEKLSVIEVEKGTSIEGIAIELPSLGGR